MPELKSRGLFLPMLLLSAFAQAQKLPNIQEGSLKAPAIVKIDGKATEWSPLKAYNHAIQASYIIANDDKRLYLVVKCDKKEVINKMINGGVTLLVNRDKKITAGSDAITYPAYATDNTDKDLVQHMDRTTILGDNSGKATVGSQWSNIPFFMKTNTPVINLEAIFRTKPGTPEADKKLDSLITASNKTLSDKVKFIRLSGFKDSPDITLSVYNKDGIKAWGALGTDRTYTIEMAIDLKYLGLSTDSLNTFNYGIRFNEIDVDYVPGMEFSRDAGGNIKELKITDQYQANSFISALSNTDCWGTYTLTK